MRAIFSNASFSGHNKNLYIEFEIKKSYSPNWIYTIQGTNDSKITIMATQILSEQFGARTNFVSASVMAPAVLLCYLHKWKRLFLHFPKIKYGPICVWSGNYVVSNNLCDLENSSGKGVELSAAGLLFICYYLCNLCPCN